MPNNLLIAIPTFENINPETFKSIFDLEKIPGWNFDFEFVKGYDCAVARNKIAKKAVDGGYDYVLMVDSDIILPKDAIVNLLQDDPEVILGWYVSKSRPHLAEIFSISGHFEESNKFYAGVIEDLPADRTIIAGGGLGCALIKVDIFKLFKSPPFLYVSYPDGNLLSEDLYFCTELHRFGKNIFVDKRVKCGHIGKFVYK